MKSQDSPEISICFKNMKFLHCSLLFTCNSKRTLEKTQSTMMKVTLRKIMVREITKLKAFIRIIKKSHPIQVSIKTVKTISKRWYNYVVNQN